MKKYLRLVALVLPLVYFGCSDNEDPDPRQQFVGTYELEDYDVTFTEGSGDTTVTLESNPEIEFEIDDNLSMGEMEVDLDEFLDESVIGTLELAFGESASIQLDDDGIAGIENTEFEINEIDFRLNIGAQQYYGELNVEGELEDGILTLDFEIIIFANGENVTFAGEATGEKD